MTVQSLLLSHPARALAGTDLRIRLPLDRTLLNKLLEQRPADGPLDQLYLDPDPGNQVHVHIAVDAPIIGTVERRITLMPGAAVSFPDQPWLQFDIVSGLKFLDKPLIKLLSGQLEARLPKGVELTTSYLRFHLPALLTAAGRQALVPLIRELRVTSEDNKLVLDLRLVSEGLIDKTKVSGV